MFTNVQGISVAANAIPSPRDWRGNPGAAAEPAAAPGPFGGGDSPSQLRLVGGDRLGLGSVPGGGGLAQVGGDHARVGADDVGRAVGDDLAELQHDDPVADGHD